MITFIPRHPKATLEHMGYFPDFLDDRDPRPAKEQINERYVHGGWEPLVPSHWTMLPGDVLQWPEDPELVPICELRLRDERIVMYQASIFAIIQPDGTFEVARCD